jgi:AbrB family looped-hinge helix DNA binding protein
MAIAYSKVTAQGQVSIPLNVRRKFGIGPGSTLEWEDDNDHIVVRQARRFSSKDIHHSLFGGRTPKRRTLRELKEGIWSYTRKRYGRD